MIRIEFLTEDDSLYILPFFEEFLRHYRRNFDIVQISCAPIMGSRPRLQLARELMWLYGISGLTQLAATQVFSKLLSGLPRSPNAGTYHSVEQACRAHGIAYAKIRNPNSPEFMQAARKRDVDLIVSVACPYILKKGLLDLPRLGCINIHHALLPRYRGMMPTFWQLYHGEKTVGLTIHRMAEAIDAGQALFQGSLEVNQGETLDQLIRRSKRHAAHELAKVVGRVARNECEPFDLPRDGGSYFTFPNRKQIAEFRAQGLRAI